MSAGAAAGAAAAMARRKREEEESMTGYSHADLAGDWEFKILRSATGAFRNPERFREAAKRDVTLTLSGHTHGGQIAFPFLYRWVTLSRLTHHYHLGVYKKGRSTLYVHPGLGTTGPPMRLGIAPAVVILTLRAA